ncbi:MAG: ATP-dependent metallopeptidase FtsH/Yme1/Tma family protein, partial [Ferrovibrionaceae bacterium]
MAGDAGNLGYATRLPAQRPGFPGCKDCVAPVEERTDVVNIFGKNLALWIIIGLLVVALFNLFQSPSVRGTGTSMAYSDFLNDVNNGQVVDVTIQGSNISGHTREGRSFTTYSPNDPAMVSKLTEKGVRV